MGAAEILRTLTDQGFTLAAAGGRLTVNPSSKLTDAMRAEIRAHKPELVELLTQAANDSRPPYLPPPPASTSHAEIEAWMDAVGETDTVTRNEVLANYGFEVKP